MKNPNLYFFSVVIFLLLYFYSFIKIWKPFFLRIDFHFQRSLQSCGTSLFFDSPVWKLKVKGNVFFSYTENPNLTHFSWPISLFVSISFKHSYQSLITSYIYSLDESANIPELNVWCIGINITCSYNKVTSLSICQRKSLKRYE
jgi:hypothetical protein